MDVTVREFARLFEFDPSYVSKLIKAGMPAAPPRRGRQGRLINIRAAADWLAAREVARVRAADGGEALAAAELRKLRAAADLAELKAASMANSVIGRDEARQVLDRVLDVAGRQVDRLPGIVVKQLAATSDPAVVRDIIFGAARQVRVRIAGELAPT